MEETVIEGLIQFEHHIVIKNPSLLREGDTIVVLRHPDLGGCATAAEVLGYNDTTREVVHHDPYWITIRLAVMEVLYHDAQITCWGEQKRATLCKIVWTAYTPDIGMRVLLPHEIWSEYLVGLPYNCQPSFISRLSPPPFFQDYVGARPVS